MHAPGPTTWPSGRIQLIQTDGLAFQQDRDPVGDRVQEFPVIGDQAFIDRRLEGCAVPIPDPAVGNRCIQPSQDIRLRGKKVPVRNRAAKYRQQAFVHVEYKLFNNNKLRAILLCYTILPCGGRQARPRHQSHSITAGAHG